MKVLLRVLTSLENPFQAGLGFTVHLGKTGDFVGRSALESLKETGGSNRKLCTIVIGEEDWLPLYGGEAVIVGGQGISRLRSAGYGHTVKRNIGFAYLPIETAAPDTVLAVEIFGEHIPARVASRILCDPTGSRLKGK